MQRSIPALAIPALVTLTLLLAACSGGQAPSDAGSSQADASAQQADSVETTLRKQMLNAQPGDVITIPAGTLHFKRGLVLRADGVTIRGAGMEKTILSFKGMVSGPQGLLVNGNDFTIQDLTIQDTMGDALKIKGGKNIIIRRVATIWTNGPDPDNGAYGIYPIRTTNLLMEGCFASGASDSGIYVGQSKNVIVRNNTVKGNVAGIEIENTTHADVYGNVATGNTGGILVFNMPNLSVEGSHTRVFDNRVFKNNHDNFGAEGTPVASIPAGSGIVINSNDYVEIFDNYIANNRTANVIISAYFSTNYYNEPGVNPDYNPYPKAIYIHDNHFEGGGGSPDGLRFKALKTAMFGITGHFPDVLWDGYADPASLGPDGLPPADERLCVPNPEVDILNFDGPNDNDNPRIQNEYFRCTLEPLSPVHLDFAKAASNEEATAPATDTKA